MPPIDVENTNIKQLAERLIDDIRRRGLLPGERYMTASEACREFEASEISVHRAMQLLADQNYLVRQRGSGTFVGARMKPKIKDVCPLRVVHVVMSMDYQRTATVPAEILVDRLGVSMPEAVVEVHYVTPSDAMRHLDGIVERIDPDEEAREGVILIRSSRKMQMYVEQAGVPAVVFGGIYPGVTRLPWLDIDQAAIGHMMARHVIKSMPRRLVLLMRDDWRRGDNRLYQGIADELGKAQYQFDALTVLSIPPENHHIAEEVHDLLSQDDSITGIMCRTHLYADVASDVVESLGKQRAAATRIVAGGGRKPPLIRYAYVAPDITEEQQVEIVGQMLLKRAIHGKSKGKANSQVVPVHLIGGD